MIKLKSAEAFPFAPSEFNFSKFLKNLESFLCFFLIMVQNLFEQLLTTWVGLNEGSLQHIDINCFVFYFAGNITQTKVNHKKSSKFS